MSVAAAANLESVLPRLTSAFEEESGVAATISFGSTAALAQQIDHGAPFDLFLAADTESVDRLIASGRLDAQTRAVYVRGRLVLWSPEATVESLQDLSSADVRFVALAKPEFAPYGRAARQALEASGLWTALEPKVVYAQNVRMARQFAESGNADAAFVAASLVVGRPGRAVEVAPALYLPIEQALAISADPESPVEARAFVEFLLGEYAQSVLGRAGYLLP